MSQDPRDYNTVMGWLREGRLPQSLETQKAEEQAKELARQVRLCFDRHPEVLQLILDMTILRPPVDYSLPKGGPFENYALVREGQNQVAASLLHYIDQAERLNNELPPHAHPGPADPLTGWGGRSAPGPAASDGFADGGPFAAIT